MRSTTHTILALVALSFIATSCGNKNGKYDASGVFEATEVIISSEATGRILYLDIEEGQEILPNVALGCIDTIQLGLKRRQLLASIGAIQSRQIDVPRQVAAIEQQIVTQKSERARFATLVKSNAANQKTVDDIDAQIKILERQLSAQREVLANNNKGLGNESLSMQISIEQLDDQINRAVIKSPIRGTILAKYAEPGELAMPGKALFKVADMENMILRAYVNSPQLTSVKVGQSVTVFADYGDSDTKKYAGTVTWISDKSEFTPKTIQTRDERSNLVYAVKISVPNDGYLKRGMYADITFADRYK